MQTSFALFGLEPTFPLPLLIPTGATGALKALAAVFALPFFLFQRLAPLYFALEVEAP
ncbi:UNVERIFIED_CONTAM: hypothetical protein Sradi_6909000 [Sesamum radiatum]|uniref:Uncharacterized protein n=1 Tax=Sesamum radiatum TaxID=300843 RepID=A0AAW2JK06_SESRA